MLTLLECSKQLVCTSWLIATLLFSTLACAAPSITLSQKTGPPTSQILISGSGFNANVQVDIYFDADDEAQVVTDTEGSFDSAKIHALQTALPGQHWVSALDLKDHQGARTKFLVETSWTQLHFGGGGNRLNPYENVVNPMNVHSLTVKWKYKMLGHINSAASVVDGVLYVGAPDGKLEAIDAETGTELWNFVTGGNGPVDTVPAVANGVVYVSNIGARTGELYALNAKTGALLWTAPYGSSYSSPAVANGIVYVGSNDDSIYAIDAKTGQLVWSYATFSTVYSSPSVVDGVVYVGSDDYGVYAFDAKTGDLLWRFATYGDISGSPAIVSGALYVTSWDGYLYAVNIRTGEQLWKFYGSNCCDESSPVVIDGTVYFGGAGGRGLAQP